MTIHRFETPGRVTVRVTNRWGPISVATDGNGSVEVELTALGGDKGEEIVEQSLVVAKEVAGGHRVDVDVPQRRLRPTIWRNPVGEVRARLSVPEGADVELTTASQDIAGDGRYGRFEATTASGDVVVDEVQGELVARTASGDVVVACSFGSTDVQTASGDVRVRRAEGPARLRSGSGDLRVDGAVGALTAKTGSGDVVAGELLAGGTLESASGDVRVERLVAGTTGVTTATGRIVVGVAVGSGIRVDASSVTGQLSSEIDLDEAPQEGAGDGPQVVLEARSVSGGIHLERAVV